jgi:hypothetical protein
VFFPVFSEYLLPLTSWCVALTQRKLHRLATFLKMSAITEKDVMERRDDNRDDEEQAFLADAQAEHKAYPQKTVSTGLSRKFWFFAALNTLSTVGIVSTYEMRILWEPTDRRTGLC